MIFWLKTKCKLLDHIFATAQFNFRICKITFMKRKEHKVDLPFIFFFSESAKYIDLLLF